MTGSVLEQRLTAFGIGGEVMSHDDQMELPPAEALQWYFDRAEEGDVRAKRELGRMFLFGFTHPDDPAVELLPDAVAAKRWLLEAADGGDEEGAFLLGQMHDGEATKGPLNNPKEAFRRYRQAVDLGFRPARFYLATRYLIGRGTKRNERLDRELLIEAAYAGDNEAQAFMAEVYGKDGNAEAASAWIIVAALFGSEHFEDQKENRVPRGTPELARQIIQKVNIYSALVECDAPILLKAADLLRKSFLEEV